MDASAAIWAEESVDGCARAPEQGDRVRRRCDGDGDLEGRGPAARGHDHALVARHRPRRGQRVPDRRLPGHAGSARDAVPEVDLVPRRRSRQRRGVRAARAADERRDARAARRPRPVVGARRDLRHAPATIHHRGGGRWHGSSSARPAGGSSRSATTSAPSGAACAVPAPRALAYGRTLEPSVRVRRERAGTARGRRRHVGRRGASSARRG